MPEPRLPMRKIRDVLRLSAAGLSKRKIAASLGIERDGRRGVPAPGAACRPRSGRCRKVSTTQTLELPPLSGACGRGEGLAGRGRTGRRSIASCAGKGVTLQLVWEEHRAAHPDGYGRSRFCELYRAWEGTAVADHATERTSPASACSSITPARRLDIDRRIDRRGAGRRSCSSLRSARRATPMPRPLGTQGAVRLDRLAHAHLRFHRRRVTAMVVSDNLQLGHHQGLLLRASASTAPTPRWRPTTTLPSCRHGRIGSRVTRPRSRSQFRSRRAWIIAKLRNRQFFSLSAVERGHRANCVAQHSTIACRAIWARAVARCSRIWNGRPSSRCRPSPTSSPNGRNARSASTTTSRSRSTTTRCRTQLLREKLWARITARTIEALPPRQARRRRMYARPPTASIRRYASTCRRATGAMLIGRRSACGGRPDEIGPQHIGAGRDHPARALAPGARLPRLRSASCDSPTDLWPRATRSRLRPRARYRCALLHARSTRS